MNKPMLAYHGRQELKDAVLAQIRQHREADRIQRGTYGRDDQWRGGCAVGCTLESLRVIEGLPTIAHADHALYERYIGVPEVLARLQDGIFEGLPEGQRLDWPERFAAAIRPGADLSMVWPQFALDLLTAPDGAVQRQCVQQPAIRASVDAVAALFRQWVGGTKPSALLWREARTVAYVASAAYAAAYVAVDVAYAPYAATEAAAFAANASSSVARQAEWSRQADALIRLLEAA